MEMPEMRRYSQSIPDEECLSMLRDGDYGVLAVHGACDYPYAVPLNYALLENDAPLPLICMHSALSGHKIDAIKANPKACFTVVEQSLIVPEEITDHYKSVIAFGRVWIEEDPKIRQDALTALGKKYCPGFDELVQADIQKSGKGCSVLLMEIECIEGKEAAKLAKERRR